MKILETKRLKIEHATLLDAQFFYALLNSANWKQFIGDFKIDSLEDAVSYLKRAILHSYEANGFGLYVMRLKTNEQSIGICGFIQRTYLEHPDLGFAVLPEYERKGYTYEASVDILKYGLKELNLTEIFAITMKENIGSIGVLKKLNFQYLKQIQPNPKGALIMLFSLNNQA